MAPLLVSRGPEWDGGKVGATVSGNSPSFRFPGSRRRSCVHLTPNGEVGGPPDTLAHAPLAAMRSSGPPEVVGLCRRRAGRSPSLRPVRGGGGGSGPSAPGQSSRVPHRAASSAESAGIRPRKRGLSLLTQRLE